jgi:hypothetical protein
MAIGIYFPPPNPPLSAQQYDACTTRLKSVGAGHPPGRVYHSAFGTPDSLQIFDVWTSREAFEKFGETLRPILQELGIVASQPSIMEVHSVITPPAARPKAAKKKAASKKGKAAKRATPKKTKKSKARRKTGKK